MALVGGETAELPGIYAEGELDFAGTCVGVVARADLIDGSTVVAGDAVIGFPSAGVHANGFTLVRRVLEDEDYDGDDLLAPTRLYLDVARALRGRAKAFAHVTGGGILGNLARVLPAGLAAPSSTGTRGRGRPCSRGSPGTSTRTSCGASSTSASAGARSSPRPQPGETVIGTDRVIGVLVSGNGTNLQALTRRRACRSRRSRRTAKTPTRCMRAREAGIPTATFSLDCHADRAERDLVMATWLEEHGVELVVLAGYMHLLTEAVPRPLPATHRQRSPVAPAGVPRRARDRRRARRRRRDDRRHRALRRRGPRHGRR